MNRNDQIIQLAGEGLNFSEIARIVGCTRQYVAQVLQKGGIQLADYRKLTEANCVYPNFRKWWNENRMTYHKFFERMGVCYHDTNISRLHSYITGKGNPRKSYIDMMIAATGIPYETLFSREGG